jgi:hypothetical protein
MMDNERITEADIEQERPAEDDLLTYDEWWREHNANICCRRPSDHCACGGYTDQLPPGASRLLTESDE